MPTPKKQKKLPPRGMKGQFINRKKELRNSPDWLGALDLGEESEPEPEPEPVRAQVPRGIIAKNAAEEWGERLPDLAIWEERRARDARKYAPTREYVAAASVVGDEAPIMPQATKLGPMRRRASNPMGEAVRNAAVFALGALGIGYAISRIPHKGRQGNR